MKGLNRILLLTYITSLSLIAGLLNADDAPAIESSNATQQTTPNPPDLSQEPGAVTFKPPAGWKMAEQKQLPPGIRAMVIGKGEHEFPPSINLGAHAFSGNIKQYLKIMKESNAAKGYEWKDLGNIKTEAGTASLSQVDMKTQWGVVREMHVLFIKNGMAYLLTVASLKEEFPAFYKEFFDTMRSFNINKDVFEMVTDFKKQQTLKKAYNQVIDSFDILVEQATKTEPGANPTDNRKTIFDSESFQKESWTPFITFLNKEYSNMGTQWRDNVLKQLKEELLETPS